MSSAPRNRFFTAGLFAAAILVAGCAADERPPAANPDPGQAQPKLVSNLSDVAAAPVNPFAIDEVPKRGEGLVVDQGPVTEGPRTYETDPGISREVGTEKYPGTVRLTNAKAAQFGNFCGVILDRIYAQLIIEERSEEMSRGKLPDGLKAVVLTAILDKSGKLTEIILEQHSGKGRVDQMFIKVCKKSIWYENPPVDALADDGTYKLMLRLKLENFASLDERHWSFVTDLGLGLG